MLFIDGLIPFRYTSTTNLALISKPITERQSGDSYLLFDFTAIALFYIILWTRFNCSAQYSSTPSPHNSVRSHYSVTLLQHEISLQCSQCCNLRSHCSVRGFVQIQWRESSQSLPAPGEKVSYESENIFWKNYESENLFLKCYESEKFIFERL